MYCDPVTENGTIEHGKIDYSYPVSPENTDFMYINTTYRVECDPGYFPANRKRVKCVINHRQRSSRWNGNLTNCSKYLQVYVVVLQCTHNIIYVCLQWFKAIGCGSRKQVVMSHIVQTLKQSHKTTVLYQVMLQVDSFFTSHR